MSLLRAIATVSSFTMLSRIAGFVRDILTAAILGTGPVADAFFLAFKLPNFLRRLFAEGAFNAGFVPLFAGFIETEGREKAREFAIEAQAVLAALLMVLTGMALLIMPLIVGLLAPGYDPDGETFGYAVTFSRITFAYIFFISLAALLGGILNSVHRFAAPAATPIILNLCLIFALLVLTNYMETPGHALSVGLIMGGVAQWLWLLWSALRIGMAPRFAWPRITERVKRLYRLILPAVFGAGIAQISLFADVIFASFLVTGSLSFLYYADRLAQLPLGVIGVAIGTALLPMLSRQIRSDHPEQAEATQNRALEAALFFALPSAAALFIMAEPIISLLFERGQFDAHATQQTAHALKAYAIGIPFFILVKVLAPQFFAREDTRTPVKIGVACLAANIVLAVTLIQFLDHAGIALATSLSSALNVILLALISLRREYWHIDATLKMRFLKLFMSALLMMVLLLFMTSATDEASRLWQVVSMIVVGGGGYVGATLLLGAINPKELKAQLRRSRA